MAKKVFGALASLLVSGVGLVSAASADDTPSQFSSDNGQQAVPAAEPALGGTPAAEAQSDAAAPAATGDEQAVVPVANPSEPATGGAQSAPGQNRLVEEIIVTAQKREEGIQKVPISISAFSAEKLDALGVQSVVQLPKITPGLTFSAEGGFNVIFLRGVGTDAFLPSADPEVPIYIDGVALLSGQGSADTLGRVSRVEILKGPQGTLFGRDASGGAISIVTPDPTANFEGDIKAEGGNYSTFNGSLFLNVPITDGLGATISGYSEQHHPFDINLTAPNIASFARGGRAKVVWKLADNFSLRATASYSRESTNKGISGENTRVAPDFAVANLIPQDPKLDRRYSDNVITGSKNRSTLFSGGFDWSLFTLNTKLLAATQQIRSPFQAYDFDGSTRPLLSFTSLDSYYHQTSIEYQVLSSTDTPLNQYFSWVTGFYYLNGIGGFPDLFLQVAAGDAVGGGGTGGVLSAIPAFAPLIDSLNTLVQKAGLSSITAVTGPLSLVSGGLLKTDSLSGYFEGTTHFAEILNLPWETNLVLGARLDRETRGLQGNRLGLVDPTGLTSNQITPLHFHVPDVSKVVIPLKAVLQTFPLEGLQLYGSFGRGFTAPTYSTVNFFGPPDAVQASQTDSFEVGAKAKLFDQSLTINSAAFLISQKNVLTGLVSLTSGGVVEFGNASKARNKGAETDITWLPLPERIPGLALVGSAMYLDAKYTDYKNGSGFDPDTGLSFGPNDPTGRARDFTGNRIPRTPKFSYNFGINQSISLQDESRIEVNLATRYSSKIFWDAQNAPEYASRSFQVYDASLSYFYTPWTMQVSAFVQNLTNTTYVASTVVLDTGRFQEANDPRVFGLKLSYTF